MDILTSSQTFWHRGKKHLEVILLVIKVFTFTNKKKTHTSLKFQQRFNSPSYDFHKILQKETRKRRRKQICDCIFKCKINTTRKAEIKRKTYWKISCIVKN